MEPNYTDRVYKMLMDLPMNTALVLEDFVAPETRERFIESCKRYINDNFYHPDHTIQIPSDYASIKKITADYFPPEKQQPF